jgi:hypothetical protein
MAPFPSFPKLLDHGKLLLYSQCPQKIERTAVPRHKGCFVKIIMSASLATRTVLVALIAGFVLGIVVGYRAGESSGDSRSPAGSPADVRALPAIPDIARTSIGQPGRSARLCGWYTALTV